MGTTFTPEERLVLYCTRSGDHPTERIEELLAESLDWEVVVEWTLIHRVGSLVYETLNQYPTDVPSEILDRLHQQSQHMAHRNLRMLQEVASLSEAFRDHDLRAIPYKGPVLTKLAYTDLKSRQFGDLDFLVDRDDIPKFRSLLAEYGYEPRYELQSTDALTDTQEWAYVRFARDYAFQNESGDVEVELHWRIVSQHFPTDIQLDDVWDHRTHTPVGGTKLPTLSPEDRIIMLCVHGSRHRWESLQWICDVAETVRNQDIDWDVVEKRAVEYQCERMVDLGLSVAAEVLDAPLPRDVRSRLERDAGLRELRTHVTDRLFDRTDYWHLDIRRFQSATIQGYKHKARFWATWLLKPNRSDIESVSLSRRLVPFYVLVHWFRVGRAGLTRLRRLLSFSGNPN